MSSYEDELKAKIARLPKYAQEHIARLERDIETRDKLLASALGESVDYLERDDAKTYISYPSDNGYREIPIRSRAIFPIAGGWVDVYADKGDGSFVVSGLGPITVEPQVSNVVRIKSARR